FLSGWPSEEVRRSIAEHGGVWPPPPAGEFAGQGLTDDQIARILARATPHPGATLTGPAVLDGSPGDLPATYVKCLLDGEDPPPAAAAHLAGGRWELGRMGTGHWPMCSRPRELARILHESAARAGRADTVGHEHPTLGRRTRRGGTDAWPDTGPTSSTRST